MKRALALTLVLCLTGCSATSALTAATGLIGNKPDLTAQVGAENTKQGIGLSGKSDSSSETTVKDSTVGTVDSSRSKAAKAQNISTGSITADRIEVRNSDNTAMILAFLSGLVPLLVVEVWVRLRKRKEARDDA
ncbi:putative spanin [Erwinia phage Zoomie]|uniref:Spanin n=1 Tax=Erwinia phage Zoomie TaxID=2851072 RepID=A0A9E6T3H4_9CAUD|nr:putative spanin [Erwinia phage Zoomie]